MTDRPSIIARNITKVYHLYDRPTDRVKEALHPLRRQYHHDFPALQDVSFEIKRGQTVAIIGRNGSGKSTLLKIITGVLTPTSGSVEVHGRISALLELGAGFNPELTGIQNVFLYGSIIGYSRDEMKRRLDDILAFADIGEFVEQPVKLYSTGMFARLAFATYIHVDPEILIVDEVLAVGDIRFQLKCRDKLLEMRERGTTIIYVTHGNQGLGDIGIMLEQGQIVKTGSLLDVWNHYHRLMTEAEASDPPESTPDAIPAPAPKPAPADSSSDKPPAPSAPDVEVHVSGGESTESTDPSATALPYRESAAFLQRVKEIHFGTAEVRIVNTELKSDQGETVAMARWGDTLSYRIHLRVDQDVPFLAAGFMIRNSAGLHILGDESWSQRVPILDLHAGDNVVVGFAFDVNFCQGEYTLTAACSSRNVEMPGETSYFDWIDNCDVLEIEPPQRQFHALYYVPTRVTACIARTSGQPPQDAEELKAQYERLSCRAS